MYEKQLMLRRINQCGKTDLNWQKPYRALFQRELLAHQVHNVSTQESTENEAEKEFN